MSDTNPKLKKFEFPIITSKDLRDPIRWEFVTIEATSMEEARAFAKALYPSKEERSSHGPN